MLPARKNAFATWLLLRYAGWRLRRQFHAIRLFGADGAAASGATYPAIFYSGHRTWWDGFLEVPLIRRYGLDHYLMMEARNLRKFPFFRRCGVFGVDLASREDGGATLLYAARLLRRAEGRRTLFMYPHGRLTPPYGEPPEIAPGLAKLLAVAPHCAAVPVAKEIVHGKYPDAEAFIEIGDPLDASMPRDTSALDAALRSAQRRLRERLAREATDAAATVLAPKRWFHGKT